MSTLMSVMTCDITVCFRVCVLFVLSEVLCDTASAAPFYRWGTEAEIFHSSQKPPLKGITQGLLAERGIEPMKAHLDPALFLLTLPRT